MSFALYKRLPTAIQLTPSWWRRLRAEAVMIAIGRHSSGWRPGQDQGWATALQRELSLYVAWLVDARRIRGGGVPERRQVINLNPAKCSMGATWIGIGMSEMIKFETRAPSAQTAVDVFRGRWASDLGPLLGVEGTGPNLLFTHDLRPQLAADALGFNGSFVGMNVLEIGPLEGGHTWSLERLGAKRVTSVEASAEAWLKCLVVKEILGLTKTEFLLGDASLYLEENSQKFDAVFCSGVLYHMNDPLRLISNLAKITSKVFVWTHIYDQDKHPVPFSPIAIERDGLNWTYW